jgi:predicted amidohydrolase YtcJ
VLTYDARVPGVLLLASCTAALCMTPARGEADRLAAVRVIQTAEAPADLAVLNGKVVTLDAGGRLAQAAAIRGGRFVAVGTDAEVRAWVGPDTRVIDAGGRTVIPGLIDSHVHALGVAATEMAQPFRNLTSVADIQAWIRERAAQTEAGTWIWTPRVFPTRIRERRFPTKDELDGAASSHPVVVDGAYALMLNSAALAAASIARGTPDPAGGAIVRDAAGDPTGLLRNVGGLLARFAPPADREDPSPDALERVHRAYLAAGITSIGERGAGLAGFRVYDALRQSGRLLVRSTVTIRIPNPRDRQAVESFVRTLPMGPRDGDEWLKARSLKIVADGGILAGTSFMRQPYGLAARRLYGVEDPGYRGFLTLTREQIAEAIAVGHGRGWQMVAHVTGDAGVDAVLDAFEAAERQRPSSGLRHTLVHAYFADPETAARAARLGVAVDTQPAWYFKDADALADALGEARLERFIGLATWLRGGALTAINTDHMFGLDPDTAMNPFNPFLTMAVAVTRRTEQGRVIGGAERISREQALRLMTREAARLSFDEDRVGSIEVGKLGDLVVLSGDLLTCPDDRLSAIRAELTVVGGRVAYEAPGRQARHVVRGFSPAHSTREKVGRSIR